MAGTSDIRKIALALAGTTEIDHHGRPAFRTKARIFAVIRPPNEKNGGLWLYLPPERKDFLFEADPKLFVKTMWGKTAEILVQAERVSRKELKALLTEAWESSLIPPKKRVSSRATR